MSNGADPTTRFLGLTKPIVNDEAGEDLWGEKLNTNFDIIDDFAAAQGELTEAPDDGSYYVRGERQWLVGNTRAEFNTLSNRVSTNEADISAVETVNAQQTTAINGKAPLGPNDGQLYGWQGTGWVVPSSGNLVINWGDIQGKPATFPPTLPIPSSGVTGLDAKQTSQDAAIAAINWSTLTGKPSTFPPTLPIPSSGVTGLDTKQAAQDADIATRLLDAPNDAFQYARQGATWQKVTGGVFLADAPPSAPDNSLWVESDSGGLFVRWNDGNSVQWVQLNAPGMPEAPVNANAYLRSGGGWVSGGTIAGNLTMGSGAILSGEFAQFQRNLPTAYAGLFNNLNTGNGAGGVLGQVNNNNTFGILGYIASGVQYSLYGNAAIYVAGGVTASSLNVSGAGTVSGGLIANTYLQANAANGNHAILAIGSGSGAGVLGYPAGQGIYGGLSYAGYGLYTPYQTYSGQQITCNGPAVIAGLITSTAGGSDVQTSSANTVMTTNGTIRRTTSSIRYKSAVEVLQDSWADKVLDLVPVYYRPAGTSDPEGYTRFGFISEQVYETDPRFSLCEPQTLVGYEEVEHTNPDGTTFVTQGDPIYEDKLDIINVDLNGIVAALQQVIKRQEARIAALEAASGV